MVSILVVLDQPLGRFRPSGYTPVRKVSILVVLDQPLGLCRSGHEHPSHIVSILVVLDQPLGQKRYFFITAQRYSFNPCCSGSASRTPSAIQPGVAALGFNPCCSGSASRTIHPATGELLEISFNPCCSGSASRTVCTEWTVLALLYVSILVVLDQPLGRSRHSVRCPGLMFQSLLFWISL